MLGKSTTSGDVDRTTRVIDSFHFFIRLLSICRIHLNYDSVQSCIVSGRERTSCPFTSTRDENGRNTSNRNSDARNFCAVSGANLRFALKAGADSLLGMHVSDCKAIRFKVASFLQSAEWCSGCDIRPDQKNAIKSSKPLGLNGTDEFTDVFRFELEQHVVCADYWQILWGHSVFVYW